MIVIVRKADSIVVGRAVDANSLHVDDDTFIVETADSPFPGFKYSESDSSFAAPELPPAPPAPIPEEISRRQFFQQLAIDGDITEDEALDAGVGVALPKKITDAIATLPSEQQFAAKMLLRSAASFERSHPMVPVLGAVLQKDKLALDQLWTKGYRL